MGKNLKGKELGKGISQRKDGLYHARYTNRFGQRKNIYGKKLPDVVKQLQEEKYKDSKKLNGIDDLMTMDRWFKIWLDTFKVGKCRDTTIASYTRIYNRWISPEIGNLKLATLTPVHLQIIVNKANSKQMRDLIKCILTNMFKYAVSSDIISRNIALEVDTTITDEKKKEPVFLNREEIETILEYSKGLAIHNIYRLMLQTGMRIGEITGLTWENVDYDNNVIHIVQQMVIVRDDKESKYTEEVHNPKTSSSVRDIPMTAEARKIFNEILEKDGVLMFPKKTDYVFQTKTHNSIRLNASLYSDRVRAKILKDYPNFKKFSLHSFRHTFASQMIEAGVNPKTLQIILGHNHLQTTMDTYCHVSDNQTQEAMKLFENGVKLA